MDSDPGGSRDIYGFICHTSYIIFVIV